MNRNAGRSSWVSSLLLMLCLIFMACLTGCGENAGGDTAKGGSTASSTAPASITLMVSSTQLNSDDATKVTLTAVVKDGGNRALSGQAVTFSTDSGTLVVTSATTDTNGNATATLGTGGDPTMRTITVTATTGSISATNTVNVTGTTISISGLQSLSFGDSTDLTIFLKNSAGVGISGKTITVTSANGNTLAATTYVTNASGQITVTVTATVGGADTITASAIGATKTYTLTVSAAILTINPPTANQQININTLQAVTATYTNAGVPVVGANVNFTTTRGTLSAATAVTNGAGAATVNVRSTNSGPADVAANVTPGPSTQVTVEFIATTPASISLQSSPAVIGTNSAGQEAEKSLLTAIVRDASNNLVKNQTVTFTIDSDVSGGRLSPASAITDSSGSANTYFIAGGATTPLNGVLIRATTGALSATTTLTVARKATFITLSTGPDISKLDPNKYQKNFVALVTDASGYPVSGATVVAAVTPIYYKKGYYVWGGSAWNPVETLATGSSTVASVPACANEDGITLNPLYDYNGILDPGEDQNGNDTLDPGNVAAVTATTTDSTGHSTLTVTYARDYAYWVNVKLQVWTTSGGSTASASSIFNLSGSGTDYSSETISPPGNPSPFGRSTTCFVDLTVTAVSTTQMSLAWQKTLLAASYNIYRDGVKIVTVPAIWTKNIYDDTGRTASTRYCYGIKKVDSLGAETAFTNADVCATTPATAPTPPVAPAFPALPILGITPQTAAGVPQMKLDWTHTPTVANPTVAALFNIYRLTGVGTPTTLHISSGMGTTTITDTKLVSASTGYCYAITAVSASGAESPKSETRCASSLP